MNKEDLISQMEKLLEGPDSQTDWERGFRVGVIECMNIIEKFC